MESICALFSVRDFAFVTDKRLDVIALVCCSDGLIAERNMALCECLFI